MPEPMAESEALHIARNPWGNSESDRRAAALRLADLVERYKAAYKNMMLFAEASGLNTVVSNRPSE